jgi:hypothetical protein
MLQFCHCFFKRNPSPKPTGELEHCEGGTICSFSFFGALRDGNKLRELCLQFISMVCACVRTDTIFSCGWICDSVSIFAKHNAE